MAQDAATHRRQCASQDQADLSRPDDADRLPVHVEAKQTVECEIPFAHPIVRAMDLAVQAEDERERMLRDGVGGVGRHANDLQSQSVGRPQVDVVESRAAQSDEPATLTSQDIECSSVALIVHEEAGCRSIALQDGRTLTESLIKVDDIVLGVAVRGVEKATIVRLRAVDGYTHR